MKLVIVESPSKAKTIEKYLGEPYIVRASVGHVRDLPKNNKKAIDIENGFEPHYEISKGKEVVLSEIKKLADKADEVILATDPDREGEAIAWHIQQAAKLVKPKRISFTEITKAAVLYALEHPRTIDQNLRKAQEARRVLDRLVGYDLSGLIWKKIRYGLSAGRVQSPALRILVEREREIKAFNPEQYFTLSALLKKTSGEEIAFEYPDQVFDAKEATRQAGIAEEKDWNIIDVQATETARSPRPPFITSTLQQTASNRLGFSPSRTMMIAQRLYEAGHITYMRTDSPSLGESAMTAINAHIKETVGEKYAESRKFAAKGKNAQEAHEAIRPSTISKESAGANDEQKKLYRLIWERTVASQMTDAKVERTKATAAPTKDPSVIFNANGSRIIFDGWMKIHPDSGSEDQILPKLNPGEGMKLVSSEKTEKFTQPPPRYTEAGLVRELEKRGIGRPSTYATIIKTLEERGYVNKENRTLIPTDTGDVVSKFLEDNFTDYISDSFTATMEDSLDGIADGTHEYEKILKDFYGPFHKEVKKRDKESEKLTNLGPAPTEFKCPVCGSNMVFKLSRNGKFMSCSRFPDCTGALTEEGKEMAKDTIIGKHPDSDLDILVKDGRFGPYLQVGEKDKKLNPKPRRASIPVEMNPQGLSMDDALKLLSLPRVLGKHPQTGVDIIANKGRFGPYVGHDRDFRSIKPPLDVYTITLDEALTLLAQEKKKRGFQKKVKTEQKNKP
ncbi:MAG TPA: type I DNA topoisomerase [Candidatus Paceibacterota bacterium]|nr:type I DNA topoisomerase [Candidatus Paceibacterota bacterium]